MAEPQDLPEPESLPLAFRRRVAHVVAVSSLAVAVLFLAWNLKWALALIFAAMLVAVFLRTGGSLMRRVVGGSAGGRGLLAFGLVLLLVGGLLGFLAAPSLMSQADRLSDRLPASLEQLRSWLDQRPWGDWALRRVGIEEQEAAPIGQAINPQVIAGRARQALGMGTTLIVSAVFLLFTGLYLAVEPGLYKRGVLWITPPRNRDRADRALDRVGHTLTRWLYGRLASMAIVGLFSGVGLWILGVPLPLINGVFAFVVCFVPNFGPIASGTPPFLLALTASEEEARFFAPGLPLALSVVVLYTAVQVVESYVITPLIQKRAVELPPALLITAQLVMGLLLGIVGVIIAAPLTAAVMAASRVLWIEGDVEHDDPRDHAAA